jgi:flagellar hook-length control protein FliK
VEQVTRHLEAMRMANGNGEISLRLQPESLGSLRVSISTQADGVVARILTETTQVQHVLEASKDQLRAALESKGLRLNTLDVSVGQGSVSDGRAAFAGPQQTLEQRAGRFAMRPRSAASTDTVDPAPISAVSTQIGLDGASRLDYRA